MNPCAHLTRECIGAERRIATQQLSRWLDATGLLSNVIRSTPSVSGGTWGPYAKEVPGIAYLDPPYAMAYRYLVTGDCTAPYAMAVLDTAYLDPRGEREGPFDLRLKGEELEAAYATSADTAEARSSSRETVPDNTSSSCANPESNTQAFVPACDRAAHLDCLEEFHSFSLDFDSLVPSFRPISTMEEQGAAYEAGGGKCGGESGLEETGR
eukprot:1588782-Rhodomonas_salina.2